MKQSDFLTEHTKDIIAIIWSVAIISFVFYILVRFGTEKEVLTLIVGFISGVASTILGAYYTTSPNRKQQENKIDNSDVNIN